MIVSEVIEALMKCNRNSEVNIVVFDEDLGKEIPYDVDFITQCVTGREPCEIHVKNFDVDI